MAKRISLNVSLTPQNQAFIDRRLRAGRYQSASELIRDALAALASRDSDERATSRNWRRKIAEGIAQADRGEVVDGERMFDALEELDRLEAKPPRSRRMRKSA